MTPHSEQAFYAWLIVIGAVCLVMLAGALIDRFFLNRRIRRQEIMTRRREKNEKK